MQPLSNNESHAKKALYIIYYAVANNNEIRTSRRAHEQLESSDKEVNL